MLAIIPASDFLIYKQKKKKKKKKNVKICLEHSIRTTPPLTAQPRAHGVVYPFEGPRRDHEGAPSGDYYHLKSVLRTQERCISLDGSRTYPGKYPITIK